MRDFPGTTISVAGSMVAYFEQPYRSRVLAILAKAYGFSATELRQIEQEAILGERFWEDDEDEADILRQWAILEAANFVNQALFPSVRNTEKVWWLWRNFEGWLECVFDLDDRDLETVFIIARHFRSSPRNWPIAYEPVVDVVPI
ncbi:hypothetical protein NKJ87_06360 [Mesorhizobium sp. M0027]|uniref:hypothetical protein n=1 Tax=unclassified Mesorhizobium TaxID=325217 RepID=UPI0012EC0D7E|nr:hypothetical protein [Mesorhizobium sp. LSHC420B00]